MGLIILIAIVAIIIYVVHKNNAKASTNNTSSISTSANHTKPSKVFTENNPYEIYEIAHALSCLAAIAGDSHVRAVLQDENPAKSWPRCMCISASIDDCISSRKEFIPIDVKQYLKTVPFNVSKSSFDYCVEYTFEPAPITPSDFKYGVIDEMKTGASRSPFVHNGSHRFSTRDSGGLVVLDVDG